MDKSNAIVEQASKISTYAIYDSLTEISELKAVLTVDHIEKHIRKHLNFCSINLMRLQKL